MLTEERSGEMLHLATMVEEDRRETYTSITLAKMMLELLDHIRVFGKYWEDEHQRLRDLLFLYRSVHADLVPRPFDEYHIEVSMSPFSLLAYRETTYTPEDFIKSVAQDIAQQLLRLYRKKEAEAQGESKE
jgi:hypothetical protein